ncbi:MAG: condensation domain-containing protein, partial [Archangium sp.]
MHNSLSNLLKALSTRGITLSMDGQRLRCHGPEESLTVEMLAELKGRRAELVHYLRAGEEHPLTHGQRSLWVLHRLAPGSAAYNLGYVARLQAGTDAGTLREAWRRLVERHAVLRTLYVSRDGEPRQRVMPETPDTLEVHEALSPEQLTSRLEVLCDTPFELEGATPVRLALLVPAEPGGQPVLVLVVHHIAADFWSLQILIHELAELYGALREGRAPRLPPAGTPFTHQALNEDRWLASPEAERHLAYWSEHLSGGLSPLELPTDRPRPPTQSFRGGCQHRPLPAALTQRLRELATQRDATPNMVLLGAFQVLLRRYSGNEDFVVGMPASNRSTPEVSGTVGFFTNPVPVRVELSGAPSFLELLRQTRSRVLRALEHQAIPLPLLVERLKPTRDPSRPPLFKPICPMAWANW